MNAKLILAGGSGFLGSAPAAHLKNKTSGLLQPYRHAVAAVSATRGPSYRYEEREESRKRLFLGNF